METDFRKELEQLINKYGKENGSDTPDFILARFLEGSLENFDAVINEREEWYGRTIKYADLPEDTREGYPFPKEGEIPPIIELDNTDPFIDYDSTGNPPLNITDIKRTGDKPDVFPSTTSES